MESPTRTSGTAADNQPLELFDQDALESSSVAPDPSSDGEGFVERRRPVAPVVVAPETATTDPGSSLLEEGGQLLLQRRWRAAERMALSAARLRDDAASHGIAAVAAANRRAGAGPRLVRLIEIAEDVDADDLERARAWTALATVSLVEHRFENADRQARNAIDFAPEEPAAWWILSASFAGLGWFDESESCAAIAERRAATRAARSLGAYEDDDLTEDDQTVLFDLAADAELADELGLADRAAEDPITALGPWLTGRATNHWAMTRTPMLWFLVPAFFLASLLGVGLAITIPFLTRELRVSRLDGAPKARAAAAWRTASGLRMAGAAATLCCVTLWIAALSLAV